MKIEGKTYGTTKSGDRVDLVTVSNSNGVSFSVMTYGATLISVKSPDKNGIPAEITLGKKDLEAYESGHPFFGSTIGRFGNRIANASFDLDGQSYKLPANDGPNCLHGGSNGFDKRIWDLFPFKDNDKAGVKFTYVSEDGEEGFPGNLEISNVFTLTEKNELSFHYEAITDKATPVNLTNHVYWNLSNNDGGTILDHELKLNCRKYIPVNDALIPTGELLDTRGTPFDFSSAKKIGKDIEASGGFDHTWLTSNYKEGMDGMGSDEEPSSVSKNEPYAVVTEETSGRKLEFFTTQPGVQFYSGNFIDNITGRNTVYNKNDGFCLETQNFPDAPNRPNFPSCILRPGKKYNHTSIIRFSVLDQALK